MATSSQSRIVYTITDEAPLLATASFLPIVQGFVAPAGIVMETADISLAGRIIAAFPEKLNANQKQADALAELGELVKKPEANIIKLPNISASIPQLKAAIVELQEKGYDIPDYPEDPQNDAEKAVQAKYKTVLGSAVNPVLRNGNSDRRPPASVKAHAKKNPHKMGVWSKDSKTHVACMSSGDFRSNEKSVTLSGAAAGNVRIEFVDNSGAVQVLKENVPVQDGDVVDATYMDLEALRVFLKEQIADAKAKGVLFSLHMKATMMKVSDPIIFGQAVRVFFADVFEKHAALFEKLGVNPNNGLGEVYAKIEGQPEEAEVKADIEASLNAQPDLMMVDAKIGKTNLHVPSDVIIDASVPPIIRWGGQTTGPDGQEHDVKIVIPDSSYAGVFAETVEFCRKNGAFDPATMGSVSNVGLMAGKAQEYGSHDKTFQAPADGTIRVIGADGKTIHENQLKKGDIWRMCQAKDIPVKNWIELAVQRARITGTPAVFWLDKDRAHDAELIKKVEAHLKTLDTDGLEIHILSPVEATRFTLERVKAGKDTISVTGNVLRDYLTDLFPILEVGTSAKMLSIVPLLNGGGLFETGAGGSAPKHVQQLTAEGHLRWDSLGEFAALAASLDHLSRVCNNARASILSKALDQATERLLAEGKSPSPKTGELDNRGSHYYLARFWAEALAEQTEDTELQTLFTPLAVALREKEADILKELDTAQGHTVDIGGYYRPDEAKMEAAMRPSKTLNRILEQGSEAGVNSNAA